MILACDTSSRRYIVLPSKLEFSCEHEHDHGIKRQNLVFLSTTSRQFFGGSRHAIKELQKSHAKRAERIGIHKLTRNGQARPDSGKVWSFSDPEQKEPWKYLAASTHPRLSTATHAFIHFSPSSELLNDHLLLLYSTTPQAFDKSPSSGIVNTTTHDRTQNFLPLHRNRLLTITIFSYLTRHSQPQK